ncbi:MAG TPA: S8 family serine peptidase, partial [Candidatus Baltobacteraceae bacterium]|nr:S8 family serine peptidase [Candidatus Baltobacteraceae bacterium]
MKKKHFALLMLAALLAEVPAGASAGLPAVLKLQDGSSVSVTASGIARIWSADRRTVTYRRLTPSLQAPQRMNAGFTMPAKAELLEQLRRSPARAFAPHEVIVEYRPGVGNISSTRSSAQTNDAQINREFTRIGADRSTHITANAYRVHITKATVRASVAALLKLPSVAYASPNWYVATMRAPGVPAPKAAAIGRLRTAASIVPSGVPANYAVSASAQSLLNAPGVNAIAAFDEIERRFHALPGDGEIVTNVSIGDLDDVSALGSGGGTPAPKGKGGGGGGPSDPCAGPVAYYGPTTEMIGGQRYIDWPAMPLIPAYVADASGNVSGSAEVCNTSDPLLGEIGLDFSMMAPLPHDRQRPQNLGSGFTDLLGIAPGAQYRLVVPANPATTIADIDAALIGASQQMPRPNVITASLGFGLDSLGYPSRYLEEDPLTNSIVASIVQQNIVVCISANDGLRLYTNAAVAPSGGSAATNLSGPGKSATDLNDVALSSAPSFVSDTGAIDVGGTTLDDIFSAPPQDPHNAAFAAQHAFPVTRYNGMMLFSSGYGSRVNVSAPADNIPAMQHSFGGPQTAVDVYIEAGTSASAPETAAAAAVALQVARLTGHPFANPQAVRAFLAQTGATVPNAPQADDNLHVGPQIDLGNMVETLLQRAGEPVSSSVPRVAVEQRRVLGLFGGVFISDTDPANIDLAGPADPYTNQPTGNDQLAWITIAPDWEGLSSGAQFALLAGKPGSKTTIATTRWARVLPAQILAAAGLPLNSASVRTVNFTYEARDRGRTIDAPVTMTFGPSDGTTMDALAPVVDPVVRSNTLAVTYDLTHVRNVGSPLIVISSPGRINPATGFLFHPQYVSALPNLKGTVYVPVDKLPGDGIYGVGIGTRPDPNGGVDVSDFAYTHVLRALHDVQANAPLLSAGAYQPAGHFLEIPLTGSVSVHWDVSNIPGANGAIVEVSAPAPNSMFLFNTFNNPGGTVRDNNGVDAGSVYATTVFGSSGSIVLDAKRIGMIPTFNHVIRIIPLAGAAAAGEGSAVSTVAYDGIAPLDGGMVTQGFSINSTGDDGFLTSWQITPQPALLTSIETFTQSTATARMTESASTADYLNTNSGIWGGDIGIVGTEDLTIKGRPPSATTYRLMNPVAGNAFTGSWQPPVLTDGVSRIVQTAPNAANSTA